MIPVTKEAYKLMHQGSLALAQVEATGIRIDVPYLQNAIKEVKQHIGQKEAELKQTEVWKIWRKRYREKANLSSRTQLGEVLFNLMGIPSTKRTKTGRPSTDEADLRTTNHPFVEEFLAKEKLVKLHTTYLLGVLNEVEGSYLHPSFALNLVRSYRSSAQNPNFQNIPIRNKEVSQWIRTAFIPRKGRTLLEIDYSQIEVRIAAAYHLDPTMIKYIEENYDMHKDMAVEIFKVRAREVSKNIRHSAKNGFVFPSFYGDYYMSISENIWNMMERDRLETTSGILIKEHLKGKGIKNLEDFQEHLRVVEGKFWNKRFPVYKQWKEDWWQSYLETGGIMTLNGFAMNGIFKRNEVINYPVQSCAFHCLLLSLIWMVRWLKKNRMETAVIGQIHDSMLLDVAKGEMNDVLEAARTIMTIDVRKHWPWIIVPLEIEAEASNENWFKKEKVAI